MKSFLLFLFVSLLIAHLSYGNTKLLISDRKDIQVINLHNGKLIRNVLLKNVNDVSALDFFYDKQIICWADLKDEFIKCTSTNQTEVETENPSLLRVIEGGIVSPDGLAIDWVTEKVYWVDSGTDKLEVAALFDSWRKVLYWTNLDQPRGLTLVPSEGIMFWCDSGSRPRIERAGMDGTHSSRKVIIDQGILWPNGLTVDYQRSILFWSDFKGNSISACDFNGQNRIMISESSNPFALSYSANTLYWTDRRTHALHYCFLNDDLRCGDVKQLSLKLPPVFVHSFTQSRQAKIYNSCLRGNGGCSHLCLLSPSSSRSSCACPTGVSLKNSNACEDGPKRMLLLARRTDLRIISLDTPDRTPVVLPVKDVRHAIAVDFDPVDRFFYWTDDDLSAIQRARFNGSQQEVVVRSPGLDSAGIAVDWFARNLYWADANHNWIEVSRLDGSSRKILLRGNLDEPRAIALCPEAGLMFWTDWGNESKIEKAFLDGSNRSVIVDKNLGWPNGVAIDHVELKVYWVDAKTQMIEVSDFDGGNRRPLLGENLSHVFGFSILGDFLYWTDWQKRTVERIHKHNTTYREILVEQLPDVMGLKALSVDPKGGFNPCVELNGGCSHLCFNRPQGLYVCDCPLGLELSPNGLTCVVPSAFMVCAQAENFFRVSMATFTTSSLPIIGLKQASSIDYDSNGRLYWSDLNSRSIMRSYLNGSGSEVIVSLGLKYPGSIAVNRFNGHIYWSDMAENRIEMSTLDGVNRLTVLWGLKSPRSLALHHSEAFLFWVEGLDSDAKIMRSYLDGSLPKIVAASNGVSIAAMAVDEKQKRLLWFSGQGGHLLSADLDGTNKKVAIETSSHPISLASRDGFIFWYDAKSQSLQMASNFSSLEISVFVRNVSLVTDMIILDNPKDRYYGTDVSNPCLLGADRTVCSHLCFRLPVSTRRVSCACPTHLSLNRDGRTCSPPSSFLILSQKSQLNRLSVPSFTGNPEPPVSPFSIDTPENVQAVDYDWVSGFVFWIESRTREIRKSRLDGSEHSSLVRLRDSAPFDLVVHPHSGLVFWSCFVNDVINATKMDGRQGGIVFSMKKIAKPRALAIVPRLDLLFFINDIKSPTINRLHLASRTHEVIVRSGLLVPSALAVDGDTGVMFWAQIEPNEIFTANLEGGNRRVLIDSKLHHPRRLAVLMNNIYWLNSEIKSVESANKFSGSERRVVLSGVPSMTDIAAVFRRKHKRSSNHTCLSEGKKCSHLCFGVQPENTRHYSSSRSNAFVYGDRDPILGASLRRGFDSSFQCQCPVDLSLSADGFSCVPKPVCPPSHFTCVSSHNCIPIHWRCDGIKECLDGSDEIGCSSHLCHPTLFKCTDGKCIDPNSVCDGVPHCSDRSDETRCCPPGETLCLSTGLCSPCPPAVFCPQATPHCPFPVTHSGGTVKPNEVGGSRNRATYAIGVLSSLLIIVGVGVAVLYYRRRPTILDEDSSGATRLEALKESRSTSSAPRGAPLMGKRAYVGGDSDPTWGLMSSSGTRAPNSGCRVTSSSSSSSITHYPRETLNPPPTPVAGQMSWVGGSNGGDNYQRCCYASSHVVVPVPPGRDSYRHYKARNRPPPPTPCSTDIMDDSDFCSSPGGLCPALSPQSTSLCESDLLLLSPHPHTPSSNESDPLPPPPTPMTSYPPSPATTDRFCPPNAPCSTPVSACLSSD